MMSSQTISTELTLKFLNNRKSVCPDVISVLVFAQNFITERTCKYNSCRQQHTCPVLVSIAQEAKFVSKSK